MTKVLVVLSHALYLRNFRSLLVEMGARGHQVDMAFSSPRADDPATIAAAFADAGRPSVVAFPRRAGWWWPVADALRGLRDYVHTLDPAFDAAPLLRERAGRRVPGLLLRLLRPGGALARRHKAVDRTLARIEASIPPDPALLDWLRARADAVVAVSPLIAGDYEQHDLVKAARALGIPVAYPVASWDNLTSKGRVQAKPDRLLVWNDVQKSEAVSLHGIPADAVVVTGAQLYDPWFAMTQRDSRAEFAARIGGADPARPIVLYAGSSPFICPDETALFARWLAGLRAAPQAALRGATVLVRPHPLHAKQWAALDFGGAEGATILWPPGGVMPIGAEDRQAYFDSVFHAAAVVGVNTSVFLEAGILGRPILALPRPGEAEAGAGTLHLRYLLDGRLVKATATPAEHFATLFATLSGPSPVEAAARETFVAGFLRPHGRARAATPIAADALLGTMAGRPELHAQTLASAAIRALLAPLAALYIRPRYLAAIAARPRRRGR